MQRNIDVAMKPRPPRTIADAIAQRKRLVFTCMACKTITSKEPNDLFFKPNMELNILEKVSVCTECGANNVPCISKTRILTISP